MLLLLQSDITPYIHTQGVASLALGWELYGLSARLWRNSQIKVAQVIL